MRRRNSSSTTSLLTGGRHPGGRALYAAVALGLILSAAPAWGDETPATDRAAAAFDEGVHLFERADFQKAAQVFLEADALVPNGEALRNAIVAARKANDHLLVARAAERAATRDDEELATQARRALAEVAPKLARVELDCAPKPCTLTLDSESVTPGARYVLPGKRQLSTTASDGHVTTERLDLEAGATYRVVLQAVKKGETRKSAKVSRAKTPPSRGGDGPSADAKGKPLSPVVFWVGVGLTAGLGGAATWSGLDALSASDDLPDPAPRADRRDALDKARRTDILLGATAVVGIVTGYAAFALVDWSGGKRAAAVTPTRGGAFVSAVGRF